LRPGKAWAEEKPSREAVYSRIALDASRLRIRRPPKNTGKKRRLSLWGSDIHGHKRDRAAWSIFLQAITDLKPDGLYLGGDVSDGQALKRHSPAATEEAVTVRYEYAETNRLMDEIDERAVHATERLWIGGNHDDDRFQKWLRSSCPSILSDSVPTLVEAVRAKDRGYRVIEGNEQPFRVGNLLLLHGHFYSKHHAAAHIGALGESCLYGHTHTPQQFTTNLNGRKVQATGAPCLRTLDREWEQQSKVHTWTNGFTVIEWVDGVKAFPRNVYIVDGVAVYAGHVWRAK
jgi:predicted phosphodiesterase